MTDKEQSDALRLAALLGHSSASSSAASRSASKEQTMTEQTQPTDAEILDAADDFRSQYKHGGTTFDEFDALDFARAVLAKWGQPAHSGEPVECDCRNPYSHDECTQQAGCKIKTKLSRKTHQPVKREPLPSVEIMRIVMGVEQQHNFLRGTTNWAAAVGRAIEAAHGIKQGGQHGTE